MDRSHESPATVGSLRPLNARLGPAHGAIGTWSAAFPDGVSRIRTPDTAGRGRRRRRVRFTQGVLPQGLSIEAQVITRKAATLRKGHQANTYACALLTAPAAVA